MILAVSLLISRRLVLTCFVAFVLPIITGTGCQTRNSSASKTSAIYLEAKAKSEAVQKVVDQLHYATDVFTNAAAGQMQNPVNTGATGSQDASMEKMIGDLDRIDISNCPTDFRVAFIKYCQGLRDVREYMNKITGWRGIIRGFFNPTVILTISEDTDRACIPFVNASNELELVCAAYGVRL